MGSDMLIRALYLPADITVDLTAAKNAATRLARNAGPDDLDRMLDNDAFADVHIDGVHPPVEVLTSELIGRHINALRSWAETCLHQALDTFTASLQHRDVHRSTFSRNPDRSGVDAYVTGGLSCTDSPTDSFTDWDIVFDTHRFPDGWVDSIGAAAGLLHPHGTCPAARAVIFYTWA